MSTVIPLIHEEWSEARNKAAVATSSGSPRRWTGWVWRSCSPMASGICCRLRSVWIV
jgi:hypothetical protein